MNAHSLNPGRPAPGRARRLAARTAMAVCAAALALPVLAAASPWDDYNPFPELPYERTTVQQDELVEAIRNPSFSKLKIDELEACRQLADDPEAPPELRRWAALYAVKTYCFSSQEAKAVEIGRKWLEANPDDPEALSARCVLAEILSDRRSPGFEPTTAEILDAYDAIFEHHDPTEWRVIEAHVHLAWRLPVLALKDPVQAAGLLQRRSRELAAAHRGVIKKFANATPEERAAGQRYIRNNIDPLWTIPVAAPPPSPEDREAMHQQFLDSLRQQGHSEEKIQELDRQLRGEK